MQHQWPRSCRATTVAQQQLQTLFRVMAVSETGFPHSLKRQTGDVTRYLLDELSRTEGLRDENDQTYSRLREAASALIFGKQEPTPATREMRAQWKVGSAHGRCPLTAGSLPAEAEEPTTEKLFSLP